MIIIAMIAILILVQNYTRLGTLLNPGFVSVYDKYMFRRPFVNDEWKLVYLKNAKIRDGLFGELTTEVQGNSGPLDFTYSPFWVDVNRWLMAMLLIAIILLIINRIIVLIKKMPEYIADIPVYAMIIFSIVGYYLSVKVLGGYVPEKAGFHATILVLLLFSVFAIVFAIFRKKSVDSENKESEKKKNSKGRKIFTTIVVIVEVLLFLILPSRFMIDAIKLSNDYKVNYAGSFKPNKVKVRYDLEKNGFAGNFANMAVDTEEGLYFIENEDSGDVYDIDADDECYEKGKTIVNTTHIRKLDENGNITDVFPADNYEKDEYYSFINIGYADDYLYASTYYYISQIDPKDGSEVEVISAQPDYYIAEMCVVDDKLYYMEHPQDKTSGNKSMAWVCEIDGNNLSEPELYVSGLDRGLFYNFKQYESSSLLTNIVIRDFVNNPYFDGARFQKCKGKILYIDRGYTWNDNYRSTNLVIRDDSNPYNVNYIDNVGGFTIYNSSIYYIQLKENGFDICKCDLDASNIEVIDTYTCDKDLTKNYYQSIYRIMIGQGKIYVSAYGEIYPKEEYYSHLEFGSIKYVTDLK